MKKYISVALCVALIVTLFSVLVMAANIDSIEFTFTAPVAGESLTISNFQTTNVNVSGITPLYCFKRDDKNFEEISSYDNSTNFYDFLDLFMQNNDAVSQIISGEEYIAIFSMDFLADVSVANDITLTETSNFTCGVMHVEKSEYDGPYFLHAYVVFTPSSLPSSESHDVKVNYVEGEKATPIYSVDITWGSMEFTYTAASEGTWNPEAHRFDNVVSGQWSHANDANKITVTNHSNTSITAEFSFNPNSSFSGLSSNFVNDSNNTLTDNELTLNSAVGSNTNAAPSASAYLELSGDITSTLPENTTCGTVTVTIK